MNYKKKSLILIILFILTIQISLLIKNRQKTSFRYFIWNIEQVSIGRLISVSFISGLVISSILNYTQHNENRNYSIKEDDEKISNDNDYSINNEENNLSYEMPPERDIRDTQPTISVNYRVIKDNGENELKDRNQNYKNTQYKDDWYNKDSEW